MKKIFGFILKVLIWTILLSCVARMPFWGSLIFSAIGVTFFAYFNRIQTKEELEEIMKAEANKNPLGKTNQPTSNHDNFYEPMWFMGGHGGHGGIDLNGHHHGGDCDHHDHN